MTATKSALVSEMSMKECNQRLIVSIYEAGTVSERRECLFEVAALAKRRVPLKMEFVRFLDTVRVLRELALSALNFPEIKGLCTGLEIPAFNPDDDYGVIDEICHLGSIGGGVEELDGRFGKMQELVRMNRPDPGGGQEFTVLYRHVGRAIGSVVSARSEGERVQALRRLRRLRVLLIPPLYDISR